MAIIKFQKCIETPWNNALLVWFGLWQVSKDCALQSALNSTNRAASFLIRAEMKIERTFNELNWGRAFWELIRHASNGIDLWFSSTMTWNYLLALYIIYIHSSETRNKSQVQVLGMSMVIDNGPIPSELNLEKGNGLDTVMWQWLWCMHWWKAQTP